MDEQRAEFETAYRQEFGKRWMCPQRQDMFKLEINRYAHLSVQDMWVMWQAATQRQQERIAELEAQVQALSLDAGRLRTSQSRTGYMCLTDFQHELGEASGGISVYADEDDLKKHRNCWKGCGILKVEVVAAIAAGKGDA